uniref:J domain-containing protein n=1 Tax=Tetradesmus obliquus TaxID=3088 RepID=A0A383W7I2_TETOB
MHCPLRTPPHSQCSRRYRGQLASRCQPALPHNRSRLLGVTQRRRTVGVQAAAKTLYEALGVSQDATDRDIKKAYRQKALKLHPDVNKAPNAQEQFLEVKNAFSVLSDAQQRAAYDRKLRGGFGDFGSWGSSAGGFGGAWGGSSSSSSAGGRPRPKQPEEEFYGLEDFFNDLEKEVNDWSKKRSASGKPASLWEELSAIGEEFVDFLEQGLKDEQQQTNSSSSKAKESWQGGGAGREGSSSFKGGGSGSSSYSSSSSSRARSPVDKFEELKRQYDLYDEGKKGGSSSSSGGSSSSSSKTSSNSSSSARTAQPPPRKTADEEIDDMLAALKKKMNK